MSATFFDPAHSTERIPPTTDLESTTDLQGHTTDLSPVTSDIEPAEIPAEILATPQLDRVEQERPARRPAAPQLLAPGAVLCDRFILERVVGSGGTAVVYQARDMSAPGDGAASVRVALKVPRADRGDRERGVAPER